MEKITLKRLTLENFRGIKQKTIEFNPNETNIIGDNKTGKSTIADAFFFLLDQKNALGEKSFEIKTINNLTGDYEHRLDHAVSGVIDINGDEIELSVIYREKWETKRGNDIEELKTHTYIYSYNGVILSQNEYHQKIADLFNGADPRLLCDIFHFSVKLNWKECRELIQQLCGGFDEIELIESFSDEEDQKVIASINGDLQDEIKQLNASIKKSKEAKKTIPARIDEVEKSKPEPLDWELIKKEIDQKNIEISEIENKLSGIKQQHDEHHKRQLSIQEEINKLKLSLSSERGKVIAEANEKRSELLRLKSSKNIELSNLKKHVYVEPIQPNITQEEIDKKHVKLEELRDKFKDAYNKDFTVYGSVCECCSQPIPEDILIKKGEEIRQKNIDQINEEGRRLKNEIERNQNEIDNYLVELRNYKEHVENHNVEVSKLQIEIERIIIPEEVTPEPSDKEIEISEKIKELEKSITAFIVENEAKLRDSLKIYRNDLYLLNESLKKQSIIDKCNSRISELNNELLTLSSGIAENERKLIVIEKFIKHKMNFIQQKSNDLFKYINIKMFDTQVNGGEAPTCIATVNNVPYPAINTGSKINAGIDICNAFQVFYGVNCPIFIDNRESITKIIETPSQIVNFIVEEGVKSIVVNN